MLPCLIRLIAVESAQHGAHTQHQHLQDASPAPPRKDSHPEIQPLTAMESAPPTMPATPARRSVARLVVPPPTPIISAAGRAGLHTHLRGQQRGCNTKRSRGGACQASRAPRLELNRLPKCGRPHLRLTPGHRSRPAPALAATAHGSSGAYSLRTSITLVCQSDTVG